MLFVPDAAFVNAVLNHEAVRPTAQAGAYKLDAAQFLREPRNTAVACVGRVMLLEHVERGSYAAHVFCLPGQRGAAALAFGRAAITWLFDIVSADRLLAAAPIQLPAVGVYCRRLGLRSAARDLFQEYFEMEAQKWVA